MAQLEDGYTRLANEIVEVMAKLKLSNYEARVLWAVWRKTYGWHKKEDWISFSQFREITGIEHDSHISRSIKSLVEKKILTKLGKSYKFNKSYLNWQVELPNQVSKVTSLGKKRLPNQADTKESKETYTKETVQKKEEGYKEFLKLKDKLIKNKTL